MWFSMAHLIMVAFIFPGCNSFSSIMPDFWGVLYFPSTIRESQWLLNMPRHILDVHILIFIGFFDLEVKLIILSFCLWFFSSWNLKFVLDYQSIFVSYCNCGFNDSNWSNNILVILTTVLVTVDAVQKYFLTSVD